MPIQVHDALVRAMSGTELSRVRTEFRLRPPEPINQRPLESRGRHCYAIKSKSHLSDWHLPAQPVDATLSSRLIRQYFH
jgi:hypothetical protein